MGDYGTEVKLLAVTAPTPNYGLEGPEELIEYAGRLCWDTTSKMGSNPTRIRDWIAIGHESVIEHASATFYIQASRILTHELVRHRLASYSQRSQRYVKENEPKYITPPEISDFPPTADSSPNPAKMFEGVMKVCWDAYGRMLAKGVKPEIARYVLPGACETQIVMTMNFRELRHFIKLRTSKRALPEMREVAGKVRSICREISPHVFEDL